MKPSLLPDAAKRARVFDKDWTYTRSEATDIRKLFERVRREIEAAAKPSPNVKQLKRSA
jgi:hypothetical protein